MTSVLGKVGTVVGAAASVAAVCGFFHFELAAARQQNEALSRQVRTMEGALATLAARPNLPPDPAACRVDEASVDVVARAASAAASQALQQAPRHAAPDTTQARVPADEAPAVSPQRSDESIANAERILDDARARGKLDGDDVRNMRLALAAGTTPEALHDFRRSIIDALNRHELTAEGHGVLP